MTGSKSGIAKFVLLFVVITLTLPACSTTGTSSTPTMNISPNRGPSGTAADIAIAGALPNAPLTLEIGSGIVSGRTDEGGNWAYQHTFTGQAGDGIAVKATIGPASEQSLSANFEVTGEGEATPEPTAEGTGELEVQVSVDPGQGPSGTKGSIRVSGEPNSAATLTIGQATVSGNTDAQGNYAHEYTFYGEEGDSIPVEAQVGSSADSPKGSASFTINGGLEQSFKSEIRIGSDDANHGPDINMPEEAKLEARSGSLVITGPAPWVAVTGELEADGSFLAEGTGEVAGFPDVTVTFSGTISMDLLQGEYTMGVEGGLPTGEPIVYLVEGRSIVAMAREAGIPEPNRVLEFFEIFNAAQAVEDSATMASLLHPAVFGIYAESDCKAYLDGIVNPTVVVDVQEITEYGEWAWTIDDRTSGVLEAYTAEIILSSDQGSAEQEVHLAVRPDGSLGWFTDCGDPRP